MSPGGDRRADVGAGRRHRSRPPPARQTVTDSRGDGVEVIRAATGGQPMGIAVDATDTWGRVFVADRSSDRLSVIFGRSPALTIDCQLDVGARPYAVAVDAASGHVLVTLRGEPRVAVVDGRADDASVLGWVELEATPAWVAIDQETRRAFVSMPEPGAVAILEPTDAAPFYERGRDVRLRARTRAGWRSTRPPVGSSSRTTASPRSADGDLGNGSVSVFDARAESPARIGESIPASVPSGIAFDPVTGNAYVLENGTDELMTIVFPQAGAPTVSRSPADPYVDEGQNVNPVDLVFLPATRELIATQASRSTSPVGGHLSVLRVDDAGRPDARPDHPRVRTHDRDRARSRQRPRLRLVPRRGRRRRARRGRRAHGRRSAGPDRRIDARSARGVVRAARTSSAPWASRCSSCCSWGPRHRSSTRRSSRTSARSRAGCDGSCLAAAGRQAGSSDSATGCRRFSDSPLGLLVYVFVAAIIYSFLTPGFPWENGLTGVRRRGRSGSRP